MRAAVSTREFVRAFAPDVVVSDILTCAPALAAELEGVPVATVVPHVYPDLAPGLPPFSIGARRPRTRVGARLWSVADRAVAVGLEQGRMEYNDARARLGLPPLPYVHTGLSRSLDDGGDAAAARVPARVAGVVPCRRAAAVGAGRAAGGAGGGVVAGRARRALDVAGPVGLAWCGRAWRDWRTSRCG